jgi:hypothetical protein
VGTVGWDQRPSGFDLAPAADVPGEQQLEFRVETRPVERPARRACRADRPCAGHQRATVESGDRFDVRVVYDAPQDHDVAFSVRERLPPAFTITDSDARPRPRYEGGGVWSWRPRSNDDGEEIELEYTVRVGSGVAPGSYDITGLVRNDTTDVERRIAGAETITIDSG